MDWFRGPVRGGITGGITRGAAYLWIVVGSKLPPGMAAQARPTASQGTSKPAPPTAPAFSNCRLVTIAHPPSQRPTSAGGRLTGRPSRVFAGSTSLESRIGGSQPPRSPHDPLTRAIPGPQPYRARVLPSRGRHGGSQAVRSSFSPSGTCNTLATHTQPTNAVAVTESR